VTLVVNRNFLLSIIFALLSDERLKAMLLHLTYFLSGIVFAIRTSDKLVERKLLSAKAMTKIGTAYVGALFFVVWWLPTAFAEFVIVIVHCFLWLIPSLIVHSRNLRFKKNFLELLNQIILGMSSGLSFRQSFDQAKRRWDFSTQQKLTEIMGHVAFSQQTSAAPANLFLKSVVEEFSLVDQQPHRALQRLQSFRHKLKLEQDFRRKSGQVTQQLRAQALILSLLYLFLLIFIAWQMGLTKYFRLTMASISLFGLGILLILNIGRRFRWKV
jgi:Flp pilus assembly protein TadB